MIIAAANIHSGKSRIRSAQIQIQLVGCRRFAMVRTWDWDHINLFKKYPQVLWNEIWTTWLPMKYSSGWLIWLILPVKRASWVHLQVSGLSVLFLWNTKLQSSATLLLRLVKDLMPSILQTDSMGRCHGQLKVTIWLWENGLVFECKLSLRTLILFKTL